MHNILVLSLVSLVCWACSCWGPLTYLLSYCVCCLLRNLLGEGSSTFRRAPCCSWACSSRRHSFHSCIWSWNIYFPLPFFAWLDFLVCLFSGTERSAGVEAELDWGRTRLRCFGNLFTFVVRRREWRIAQPRVSLESFWGNVPSFFQVHNN